MLGVIVGEDVMVGVIVFVGIGVELGIIAQHFIVKISLIFNYLLYW